MTHRLKKIALAVLILIIGVNSIWAEGPISPTPTTVSPEVKPSLKDEPKTTAEGKQTLQSEIEKYISHLIDDNPLVIEEARQELLEIGKAAIPQLIKALESEKTSLRYLVCEILVELRDEQTLPVLIKLLNDKGDVGNSIASVAARGLGRLGNSTAITPLITASSSADVELRYETVRALGALRTPEIIPIALAALTDTAKTNFDYLVKCAAIESLGKVKARSAVKQLVNLLEDMTIEPAKERPVVYYVVKALENITGNSFGSISLKDEKKRGEIIKQWQEWWEKNKGDYGEIVAPPPPPPPPTPSDEPEKKPEQPNTPAPEGTTPKKPE